MVLIWTCGTGGISTEWCKVWPEGFSVWLLRPVKEGGVSKAFRHIGHSVSPLSTA